MHAKALVLCLTLFITVQAQDIALANQTLTNINELARLIETAQESVYIIASTLPREVTSALTKVQPRLPTVSTTPPIRLLLAAGFSDAELRKLERAGVAIKTAPTLDSAFIVIDNRFAIMGDLIIGGDSAQIIDATAYDPFAFTFLETAWIHAASF